ncbi:MAG: phosphoribosyltransferase family protein [candidate division WOR-3 bacterium]|nr:phosphoribosyltransferase family protein [candidate division WOR-3 bacterium]MCX7757129.1 phosphoribosyltransferase family protein [candidate division WOR-3 bacterium]MDW7987805.1 phosphoribosyltransferase family protein [candidate division WOR-3 bacterium]
MKLEQIPIVALEVKNNIVRFTTPLIFENREIKQLVNNVFKTYKGKINSNITRIGTGKHEANALIFPFYKKTRTILYFNAIFDTDKTHFSFETANHMEALKLFRLLREQYRIVPDVKMLTKLKGSFSEIIAALLWQIGAIKVSLGDIKPFFKVDERKNFSPIYIDIKILPSFPLVYNFVISSACLFLENLEFDLVCGIEAGSITLANSIAQKFSKPSLFARRRRRYYEAPLLEGINPALLLHKKVLVVDDTIVSGQTKLNVCQEIRRLGGEVNKCFVIFDRCEKGAEVLKKINVELLSLTNINSALSSNIPQEITQLTPEEYAELKLYFQSPKNWHRLRGLKYYEETKR